MQGLRKPLTWAVERLALLLVIGSLVCTGATPGLAATPTPPPPTAPSASPTPTPNGPNNPQIVGGVEVSPRGKYPWQVALVSPLHWWQSLFFGSTYRDHQFCGGSLIDASWVLTAAHCMYDNARPLAAGDFDVLAGIHDLSSPDAGYQDVHVKQIFVNSAYATDGQSDLALLELAQPVPLRDGPGLPIHTVTTASDPATPVLASYGTLMGWGSLSHYGDAIVPADLPSRLRETTLPITGILGNLLVVGNSSSISTACSGDSGGPLVVPSGSGWILAGVAHTTTVTPDNLCAAPTGYIKVSNFSAWINALTHPGAIHGTVKYAGGQVADGIHVSLFIPGYFTSTVTDANGNYSFNYSPSGLVYLTATRMLGTGQFLRGTLDINVTAAQNSPAPDLVLQPVASGSHNDATFVSQNPPLDFPVTPLQSLAQAWRVSNSGETAWGAGYALVHTDGDPLGAPSSTPLPSVAPGASADLSLNLVAPSAPGSHAGYWQLRDPQGTFFGPILTARLTVLGGSTGGGHITLFDVTPPSPTSATLVHLVGRLTYFPEFRSARFVLGSQSIEMPNIKQIGDQLEISTDWNTSSLPRGGYALAFEVATTGDPGWANPERQIIPYTLTGSPTGIGRPPERPVLESPYNFFLVDNGGSPAAVQMCVYPSSDPDGNPVQYYFDLNNGAQNSGWISSTCWSPTLAAGGYAWRVKAGDGTNSSDWSTDTWNFNVATGDVVIGSPSVYLPNDPTNTHICVLVTYGGIIAPEVRAWINSANDGTQNGNWIQLDHYGPDAAPDCTSSNVHGFWLRSVNYTTGTHVIRISARKPDNGYSTTTTFTHDIPYMVPPTPQLAAPATADVNGTWWNSYTIHYAWTVPLRTDSQTLRVSTNADLWNDPHPLVNLALGPTVTATASTFAQDYGQLYWGIRATNASGSSDSASGVWFGIDHVPPTCSMQSLPATTYNNVFQVNWSGSDNSAGVRTYDLQVLDSGRGAWSDWQLTVPVTKTFDLFNGEPGHSYGFRCRATDQAGNTGNYPAGAQATIRIDPSTLPPTPWWNNAYAFKRNLTILNNMPSTDLPANYPVHLHFDGTTSPTAAEIYNASQSANKCDDLRIVYNDTTELNRLVPICSNSAIDIWYRTQVVIPAATSNSTVHQLYIGNAAASSPPADPSQIWYPYYESGTTNLYFFQEGSGTTAYDASGNGRNCSIDSSVAWSSGRWGDGLYFDRANSGNSRSLNCGTVPALGAFSIEFWYKAGTDGDGRIAGALAGGGNGGGGNNWLLESQSKHIVLTVWPCGPCGSSSVTSSFDLGQSPYVNQWNLIAVTFDGSSTVKIWINGNLDTTGTLSGSGINTFTPPLEIGSAEGISQLKGYLGALRIVNSVKTSFSYGGLAGITSEPTAAAGGPLTPPASGHPDLVVTGLQVLPYSGSGTLVQATIVNSGTLDTLSGFFTDVYLNHLPSGSGDLTGSVRFWVDEPIAAGAAVTLTTVLTDVTGAAGMAVRSIPSGPSGVITETSGTLYAQADSTGAVNQPNRAGTIYAVGTTVCVASPDGYEPDDQFALATSIALGQTQMRNITRPSDEDWVKFSAQAGVTYTVAAEAAGPAADPTLELYAADGTTLLASSAHYAGSPEAVITWTPQAAGLFYIRARHWDPTASGCGTAYTLTVYPPETPTAPGARVYLPLITNGGSAGGNTKLSWQTGTAMPTPRYAFGIAAVGGKIYVAGGDNYTNTPLNVFEAYDTAGGTWTTLASMPTRRWSLALAAAPNGRLYAIGGFSCGAGDCGAGQPHYVGTVEEYNPATNTWAAKASMPTARSDFGASLAANGKIYAIGGQNASGDLASVEAYDPTANAWTTGANMPTPRHLLGVAAANGQLYAVGGQFFATVEAYNPASNTWSSRASLPVALKGFGIATALNGKPYLVSGETSVQIVNSVLVYDPAANSWTPDTAIPTPRRGLGVVLGSDGRLYAVGGWGLGGSPGYGGSGALGTLEVGTIGL